MPPFRDDQIFIIAPGSQTTLAQLGLPESFTPARNRFPSRMFPAEQGGAYEAVKVRRKERAPPPAPQPPSAAAAVAAMSSAAGPTPPSGDATPNGGGGGNGDGTTTDDEAAAETAEWEEDPLSDEGAVWPLRKGSIVDWPCFYALMEHVHNAVNPPFHTPVLLVTPPAWTHREHERVAQFFFEKFKVPGLAVMDAAVAASYAYGIPTATVVDVGLEKADISCIADYVLQDVGRSLAVPDCGGETMTERLVEVLKGRKGFTREVCEQLKKSSICEILLPDEDLPTGEAALTTDAISNPAAAASTGVDGADPGQRKSSVVGELPRGPGPGTEVGEEQKAGEEDGVIDIASIVTGGNMNEYLAQKEREKAEKAAARQQRKAADAQQNQAAKPARLPNSKRARNTFIYEDRALLNAMTKAGTSFQSMANMQSALDEAPSKRQKTPEPQSAVSDRPVDAEFAQQEASSATSLTGGFRREIEVGLERFQAASGGILDTLSDAIYRTVQSCNEINKRSDLWDSLIILGNGSKIRGFKEALIATLQAKYIISPSSATIFTSELPSNISTPIATGANTPQPQLPGQQPPHPGSSVNPLLHAALTAQNPQLQHAPALSQPPPHSMHSSHGQSPTSIKIAKIPEYFPEWKEAGYEEATFLGAQVAGRLLFIVDGGASKGYMTRTDYNEQGPSGIHDVRM